jgi:hypothetical protein
LIADNNNTIAAVATNAMSRECAPLSAVYLIASSRSDQHNPKLASKIAARTACILLPIFSGVAEIDFFSS